MPWPGFEPGSLPIFSFEEHNSSCTSKGQNDWPDYTTKALRVYLHQNITNDVRVLPPNLLVKTGHF